MTTFTENSVPAAMPGKIWRSACGMLSLPAPRQGVCKMAEENKAKEYGLLRRVSSPRELKKLAPEELHAYCDELRRYIIEECSVNPGHLASSLGAVELAAALHYVYDTPEARSEKREPTTINRSLSIRLKFAVFVPCIPSIPT